MIQVGYDSHAVTTLHGGFGFQSTIAFAPGEQVENVALGDAALWRATPNKRADLLFLKPATHKRPHVQLGRIGGERRIIDIRTHAPEAA